MWNGHGNPNDHHRNRNYPPPPPPGYPPYGQPHGSFPEPPMYHYPYTSYWPPPQQPQIPPAGDLMYGRHHSGEHVDSEEPEMSEPVVAARGKPEAMAQAMAAANIDSKIEEVEEMKCKEEERLEEDDDGLDDDDDDEDDDDEVVEAVVQADVVDNEDEMEAAEAEPVAAPAPPPASTPKKTPDSKKKSASRKSRKSPSSPAPTPSKSLDLLKVPVESVSEAEWKNLEALMVQFCRVPLLAEFSRPVSLLYPELVNTYSKIVKHPLDLGHICRGIRRQQYKNLRDVRLDMWRVFANCVKYHSHPNNKEAVPSFVSIALHLREYFNNLWNEYMLPSDMPENASKTTQELFAKRQADRKNNLENSGVLMMNKKIMTLASEALKTFLEEGGLVDRMDTKAIFGPDAIDSDPELDMVFANLEQVYNHIAGMEEDYGVEAYYQDLKRAYTEDVLEDKPGLKNRISHRIDRMFWKLFMPLHEANSRGVSQSSIWGNIAATIWARESSKKPYWPALCLGILAPEDQREAWHDRITERNELRLPDKLRAPLEAAKKKCVGAQNRQPLSYFLVEFLGTHEFIWIRETDIVENFDAEKDPNKEASNSSSKKKRSSRSATSNVLGSETYASALEECTWALEEYESVLQDCYSFTGEADPEEEEETEDVNYSYSLLAQSDDEADDEDSQGYAYDESNMSLSDVEEVNWLLEHSGKLDSNAIGRKSTKKRAPPAKKKVEKSEPKSKKKDSKSSKDSKSQKSREEKAREVSREKEERKEIRELDKRRRRRVRERDKVLREEDRKAKRRRSSIAGEDEDQRGLSLDKRARSTAIVRAYLTRLSKDENCKSLGLSGVMAMPASMVDSTGLLGMALAFRSAAGELPMPDDGEELMVKQRPWTGIDTKAPKTSKERVEALKKKMELLEERIRNVKGNTKRRTELAEKANMERKRLDNEVETDDKTARRNPYKKKKKYASPASTPKSKSGSHGGGGAKSKDVDHEAANEDDQTNGPVEEEEVDAVADDATGVSVDSNRHDAESVASRDNMSVDGASTN